MTDSPETKPTMATIGDTDFTEGFTMDIADARAQANEKPGQTIVGTAILKITDEFKLYKYYAIKWPFLASSFIFEVGSVLCGVAQNSKTLVVGRAIASATPSCH